MKPLRINIDELAFVLHRGSGLEMKCFLDLKSGQIINVPTNRDVVKQILHLRENNFSPDALSNEVIAEKKETLLEIPDRFDLIIFDLMSKFIRSIQQEDDRFAEKLWEIVHRGKGYKVFHTAISERYGMLKKFIRLKDEMFEQAALKWLEENKIIWQPLEAD